MSEREPNPSFLHKKFRDLNASPEVDAIQPLKIYLF